MSNRDNDKFKEMVETCFAQERTFQDVATEHKDWKKDQNILIKSMSDETGFSVREVWAQVKIKMNEAEARQQLEELKDNLDTHDELYGADGGSDDDSDGLD